MFSQALFCYRSFLIAQNLTSSRQFASFLRDYYRVGCVRRTSQGQD